MPQSYTTGGDSWQDIKADKISGQTFRPESDFVLEWIDLWLDKKPVMPEAVVQIFLADGLHHPFGDCLSRNRVTIDAESLPGGVWHVRFSMQPFLLSNGEYYCLQVSYYPPIWGGVLRWRYDAGDASYPRGLRIQSDDHGETWTNYHSDDHIFTLWGTPPVPPPPPEPPINNIAILNIQKVDTVTGLKLVVTTNVPCHLYAAYTLEKPLKHYLTRTRRGLPLLDDTRWCFINWTQNEQLEEGDTIIHTFTKEPWAVCETRYFVFRGKVDGEWVPSASPIFTIHRVYIPRLVTAHFHPHPFWYPPGATCCDGYAAHVALGVSWPTIHEGGGTAGTSNTTKADVRISSWDVDLMWYHIERPIFVFDTTEIPEGSEIVSATLHIYGVAKVNTLLLDAALNVYTADPGSDTDIVKWDYNEMDMVALATKIPYASFVVSDFNHLVFTEAGLIAIIPNGITKLALREANYDATWRRPPWRSYKHMWMSVAQSEGAEERWADLEVTYRPPP